MQSLAPYCAVDLCVSRQLLLLLIFKVYREPPSTAHSFITKYFLIDTKFHKLVGFFLHFVEMLFSRWRIWKSIIKQTLINLWRLLLTCKKLFLCSWSLMKLKYFMWSELVSERRLNEVNRAPRHRKKQFRDFFSSLLSIFFLYQTNQKTIAEFFNDTKRETVGGCWRCRSIKLFNIAGI